MYGIQTLELRRMVKIQDTSSGYIVGAIYGLINQHGPKDNGYLKYS
jgi:hypothetical protein